MNARRNYTTTLMPNNAAQGAVARAASLCLVALTLTACASGSSRFETQRHAQTSYNANSAATRGSAPGRHGRYKLGKPYRIGGRLYVPRHEPGYDRRGIASWYGRKFHGRKTANGEVYDLNALTAAHPTLPMPSRVEVTNLENGRRIVVRVNDRGPFVRGRMIDLSRGAARRLGYEHQGTTRVRVRYLGPAR